MNSTSIDWARAVAEWTVYARLEQGHSPGSVEQRACKLKHFAKYLHERFDLENPPICRVELHHIRQFITYLADERGVCAVTVRTYLEALRALFAYSVEYGYAKDSPPHRMRMPKRNPPKRELVSDEEEMRLFAACELIRHPWKSRMGSAILATYCYGGLRTKELLSLKTSDLSFEKEDCFVQVSCGKGGKRRVVPLHRDAIPYLRAYLEVRPRTEHDGLWVTDKVRPLKETGLRNLFEEIKWLARINRPGVKPHALRHKYATRKLRDGVNIYHISQLLGHSDIKTTITYLHTDLQQLTDAAQKGGLSA